MKCLTKEHQDIISGPFAAKETDPGSIVAADWWLNETDYHSERFPAFPVQCSDRNNMIAADISPWWGSSRACSPKVYCHTGKAPCVLHVRERHSHRTTRRRTARWSTSTGWTAGRWTGRCRWVLRREKGHNDQIWGIINVLIYIINLESLRWTVTAKLLRPLMSLTFTQWLTGAPSNGDSGRCPQHESWFWERKSNTCCILHMQ